jgi:hypothetical protein
MGIGQCPPRPNDRLKLTLRKAYGLRTFRAPEVGRYHSLGTLPEPQLTYRFCSGVSFSILSIANHKSKIANVQAGNWKLDRPQFLFSRFHFLFS